MEKRSGFLSKRIRFTWWQKLLLIAGCTLIVVFAAWIFCERIVSPRYISSVRTRLHIEDQEALLSSGSADMASVTYNIPGGLSEELGKVSEKGNKGLFYRNIGTGLYSETGMKINPRNLQDMIKVTTDPEDASGKTVLITIRHEDAGMRQTIADGAAGQFGTLLFGAPADDTKAEVSMAEDDENHSTVIRYRLTDDAAAGLPKRYQSGVALDLVSPLEACLADDGFLTRAAGTAGIDAKPAEIRERIRYETTSRSEDIDLNVSWTDPESAKKLAAATGEELARTFFGGELQPWQATVDEPVIVTENIREWPNTQVTMILAGLIALVISYALFSQQSLFDTIVIIVFVLFTIICVFPFYYLFINTISDNDLVQGGQINFIPRGIHGNNYQDILGRNEKGNLNNPDIIQATWVTLGRTVLGTALMVLVSAWAGYLVTKRKMWHRSFWYRALVVTMYFNAGLIPWYTNMMMLGLRGSFLAYILPGLVAPYNIILVKTYIESIPGSLEESAIIDGASTFKVFLRIILPLSIPILATIAIFGAVGNWNSFQDSYLLMKKNPELYTLQHRLYSYLTLTTDIDTEKISQETAERITNTGVTTKYTIAMITIIPILLVYPVMQRYFVKGIMLGAVKG